MDLVEVSETHRSDILDRAFIVIDTTDEYLHERALSYSIFSHDRYPIGGIDYGRYSSEYDLSLSLIVDDIDIEVIH